MTINAIIPDEKRVAMILAFLEAGYADQLLLSSDFSNGRALKKNGGPGIAQTVTVFAPMLVKAGVSEATLRSDSRRQPAPLPGRQPEVDLRYTTRVAGCAAAAAPRPMPTPVMIGIRPTAI